MSVTVAFCRADSAQATCSWRYAAVRRDDIRYSHDARAWIWYASPIHIWPVNRCPGCGGELPDLGTIVGGWQANGWPADDEEGA